MDNLTYRAMHSELDELVRAWGVTATIEGLARWLGENGMGRDEDDQQGLTMDRIIEADLATITRKRDMSVY